MKSSDSVKTYLREIRLVPLLTKDEEIELAKCVEDCRVAIIHKLLDTGVLTGQEIMKQVQNDRVRDDETVFSDDETEADDAGTDIFDIAEEISALCESGMNKDLLVARILDADRRTGIIEKAIEKMGVDRKEGNGGLSRILSSIDEIEQRMQEAKDRFIRANLRLTADIARRYSRNDTQLMDLIQEGNIGLMKAVDKFDYRKGYRFATYATWWIRQYIMKAALLSGSSLNIPAHIASEINRMMRTSVSFVQENGREPAPEELAEKMGLPVEKIKSYMDMMMHREVSLDAPAGEDGEGSLSAFVEDMGQSSPVDDIISDELMNELNEVLSALSPKQEKVIRMKFGIGEARRYTMEEIAKQLKISRERVSQLETKALRKLRHPKASGSLKMFLNK